LIEAYNFETDELIDLRILFPDRNIHILACKALWHGNYIYAVVSATYDTTYRSYIIVVHKSGINVRTVYKDNILPASIQILEGLDTDHVFVMLDKTYVVDSAGSVSVVDGTSSGVASSINHITGRIGVVDNNNDSITVTTFNPYTTGSKSSIQINQIMNRPYFCNIGQTGAIYIEGYRGSTPIKYIITPDNTAIDVSNDSVNYDSLGILSYEITQNWTLEGPPNTKQPIANSTAEFVTSNDIGIERNIGIGNIIRSIKIHKI